MSSKQEDGRQSTSPHAANAALTSIEQTAGERGVAPPASASRYTEKELLRLAVHEVGHALVALSVGYASSATIALSRVFDPAAWYLGGMTDFDLIEDRLPTETSLLNRIAVGYGGMAAEVVVFNDRSVDSGGIFGSDIERVTAIARRMVGSFGFGKTPGYLAAVDTLGYNALPERLEKQALRILDAEYRRALEILGGERDRIMSLANNAVSHRSVKIGWPNGQPPNT
ncbi:hypothetical protein [Rhizobium leguminosarum]|uniref:hypothetical protein n=1 Tax=Rhizobium leguminosarum TaxID=384 RepID=UPI000A102A01|nr:hypothetical protein [Rhizobium leguminosarum]